MNETIHAILGSLKRLFQPENRRLLICLATIGLLILATLIALTAVPHETSEATIPDYARTATWQTYTLDAGNGTAIRLRAPEQPALLDSSTLALRRFVCAKPQVILVCAAMPLASQLYDANPQNAGNPVRQALDKEKLDAMRETLRQSVTAELSTASFADAPLTLKGTPTFTPCLYRNRHADFFTAQAANAENQEGTMAVNGKIIYLPDAIFYVYGFSVSDLGAMLLETALDSLSF